MSRTRSEYRLSLAPEQFAPAVGSVVPPEDGDRDGLARLMLDAYKGTVDDEGETMVEALEAVDAMLSRALRDYSFVLKQDSAPIAMSFVLIFRGTHYIDPIVVAAAHKGNGLGRRMVETSLASVAASGVTEIGATITDGNEPSERLFASLGAVRVGPWPPVEADSDN